MEAAANAPASDSQPPSPREDLHLPLHGMQTPILVPLRHICYIPVVWFEISPVELRIFGIKGAVEIPEDVERWEEEPDH